MKRLIALAAVALASQAVTAFAGPEVPSKAVVAPPPPPPEFFRPNEFDIGAFGTYALIGFAQSLGCKELWVYTSSSDKIAVNFYRSLSFQKLGAAADWAPGKTMDNSDIILRRTLS